MRIALYCRVSTRNQNVETQLLPLRKYAADRGFQIAGEFLDVGVSGAKSRRPGLDRLMSDARARRIDGVLVFRLDRAARSVTHLLSMLEEFKSLGVEFISMNEQVDTTTPLGKALFAIIGAIAQLERDIIRERVVAGLERAKAAGVRLGRPKKEVNASLVRDTYERLRSVRDVSRTLGLSRSLVFRTLAAMKPTAAAQTLVSAASA